MKDFLKSAAEQRGATICREKEQLNSKQPSWEEPLNPAARAFFEPRFGHDFSRVRVHRDSRATESAREVNALAYIVGRDIVFGAGQYVPHTSVGRHLLAHKLVHLVQRGGKAWGLQQESKITDENDRYEREAERNAAQLMSGAKVQVTSKSREGPSR